jgi:hypothetical protein
MRLESRIFLVILRRLVNLGLDIFKEWIGCGRCISLDKQQKEDYQKFLGERQLK